MGKHGLNSKGATLVRGGRRLVLLLVLAIAAIAFVAIALGPVGQILWRGSPESMQRHRIERAAQRIVTEQFSLLAEGEAKSLRERLTSCASERQFELLLATQRPAYFKSVIGRKISGERLPDRGWERMFWMLSEHPTEIDPADLRKLLYAGLGQGTHDACLSIMGASGDERYIDDVCAFLPSNTAVQAYARLAGREALPVILLSVNLPGGNPPPNGRTTEAAIRALGSLKDAELLPLLNDIGEREMAMRVVVEQVLSNIDDPATVTVAANLFSLPSPYMHGELPNEGRWHGNAHSAARNVLDLAARARGLPSPNGDWASWWNSTHQSFPAIKDVRAKLDSDKYLRLQVQGQLILEQQRRARRGY